MRRALTLIPLLTASLAWAEPSESAPESIIEKQLIKPLKVKEERNSRFSRAYLPPQARRVRLLDEKPLADAKGAAFVTFAVDARQGYAEDIEKYWRKAVIAGCVYPETGEVFVKRGEAYFPAGILLGKKTSAASEDVCQGKSAEVASAK